MPWTEITREHYRRDELRYASDMTDAEWGLIKRLLPRANRRGRPRKTDLRRVVEAVLYILSTGCQWRALPQEFPPYSTVQGYFYAWRDTGRWQRIVSILVRRARKKLGRTPKPTAAVIDSQSAPTTQAGGPRGYDAGKRIYGRKRHIVTDTNGLLLGVHVHPANVQDCHGAVPLLKKVGMKFPRLRHVFADRIYRGKQLLDALSESGPWTVEIVERPQGVKGFQLLPRRWVVERTFAWFGRCRRLSKDSRERRPPKLHGSSSHTSGFSRADWRPPIFDNL
jgi:transposase